MVISMLKIRRPLGRLIFNMGIAIPGKTVFLIETPPRCWPFYISLFLFVMLVVLPELQCIVILFTAVYYWSLRIFGYMQRVRSFDWLIAFRNKFVIFPSPRHNVAPSHRVIFHKLDAAVGYMKRHYNDVIMDAIASQITSLAIVSSAL